MYRCSSGPAGPLTALAREPCAHAVAPHVERQPVRPQSDRSDADAAGGEGGPPLRLTSLASLALTAPGKERSREVCRVAVSFRRAGLLLWRIRIWLNHL